MKELWDDKTPENTDYVVVHWRDIKDSSQWSSSDSADIRPARHLATIGWLLYTGQDPDEVGSNITVIAKSYDYEEKCWADYTIFPHQTIRQIKDISCADIVN